MADDNDVPPPPAVPSEVAPTTLASEEVLTVREVSPPVAEKEVPPPEVVGVGKAKLPQNLVLFNEESNRLPDLGEPERENPKDENVKPMENPTIEFIEDVSMWGIPLPKDGRSESEIRAMEELKQAVEEAIASCVLVSRPPPPPPQSAEQAPVKIEEAAKKTEQAASHEESAKDGNVKPKFLRVREFKVKDAFSMLKNTLLWRKDFGIEALVDVDLGEHLDKVLYMHGFDREGHPVCYNVYGEFQNKELYQKTKRMKFLRWRIRFLERSIRKLDFTPGGVNTIVRVNALKNSPGPGEKELRHAIEQALLLLLDKHPEFVAKQVFINVPGWYLAFYMMISPFLTERTKNKFVFASPAKSAETLFKYISPEQVPIQYGGLSVVYCDCNPYFSISDPAKEFNIKPSTKINCRISVYKRCDIVWEFRVVGWEVIYGAKFIPNSKDEYTLILRRTTKMSPTDDPVVCNRFRIKEPGKIVITIDNRTQKEKKLLYRMKVKPYTY